MNTAWSRNHASKLLKPNEPILHGYFAGGNALKPKRDNILNS